MYLDVPAQSVIHSQSPQVPQRGVWRKTEINIWIDDAGQLDYKNEHATNPNPGAFRLGSIERRAARALIERKSEPELVVRIVFVGGSGERAPPRKAIRGPNIVIECAYGDEPDDPPT